MSDTTFSSIAAELVSEQLRLRDDRIAELEAENARQKEALAEVREIYAGSEGIPVAETCAEAYVIRLIEQMYSIAVDALNPTSAGDA